VQHDHESRDYCDDSVLLRATLDVVVSDQAILTCVYFFAFKRLKRGGADEWERDKAEELLEEQGAVGSLDKQGPRGGVQSPPQALRAKCSPARQ